MDEASKQFIGGVLIGSGVIGVLAAYIWVKIRTMKLKRRAGSY